MTPSLADHIDQILPQTQCTRCGYDGCRPYAEAIAEGQADLNQCPPGGVATIAALAQLLGTAPKPLNPAFGVTPQAPTVAVIDEALCIGCFKCVLACPVDAILGSPKRMHTVLAAQCSGCELCLPPCPVDCIAMVARPAALPSAAAMAPQWRRQHAAREARLERERQARTAARRRPRSSLKDQAGTFDIAAAVARSLARAAARRSKPDPA
jgi:electron transport complex protein RnfB